MNADSPIDAQRRAVVQRPEPLPVPAAPQQYTVVNQPLRVLELVSEITRGSRFQLSLGDERVLAGTLMATTANGRGSGALQMDARLDVPLDAPEAWRQRSAYLWVPHPSGILAMRVPVVFAEPTRVRLGLPQDIVRYVRRHGARIRLPEHNPVRLSIPLAEGGFAHAHRVLDISQQGASVELPADVDLPVDTQVNAALFLHRGKPLGVVIRCAHLQAAADGGVVVAGLQFVGTPQVTRLALDRFVTAAETLTAPPAGSDPVGDVAGLEAALEAPAPASAEQAAHDAG